MYEYMIFKKNHIIITCWNSEAFVFVDAALPILADNTSFFYISCHIQHISFMKSKLSKRRDLRL